MLCICFGGTDKLNLQSYLTYSIKMKKTPFSNNTITVIFAIKLPSLSVFLKKKNSLPLNFPCLRMLVALVGYAPDEDGIGKLFHK